MEVDGRGLDLNAAIVDTYRGLVEKITTIMPQWEAFFRPVIYCNPALVPQVAKWEGKYLGIDGDILEVISDESIINDENTTDLYIRFLEVVVDG